MLPYGVLPMSKSLNEKNPDTAGKRSYRVLMIAPTSFFADYGCHVRILEEARSLPTASSSRLLSLVRNVLDTPV